MVSFGILFWRGDRPKTLEEQKCSLTQNRMSTEEKTKAPEPHWVEMCTKIDQMLVGT